ncbi:hypothetical protein NSE_0564 [Neorickettsia sennetsu str. Miyayama]|uniref:Uncharacterized protein n=1 Tax=Ehrlichia sennetsu (strain ATCC VR-367 / Miyayama) TaxID=222891 RepID=Q2GDK0_EHRS3|nr:hypothetical protein NSE_0564 [Neorickettsia sennetsu str. Miyayama]
MLFYRVLLFSYLIDSLLTLIPKLILAVAYLFFSSVILIALLTTSISTTKHAILNPGESLHYLLGYLRWLWFNKRHISLEYFFYTLISFITPYLSWKYIKKTAKTTIGKLRKSGKQYLKALKSQVLKKLLSKCARHRANQPVSPGKRRINKLNNRNDTFSYTCHHPSYIQDNVTPTHPPHENVRVQQEMDQQQKRNDATPMREQPTEDR